MGSWGSKPEIHHEDMTGKFVIVTGANTGIGYETAKQLAFMGAKVIMACRDEARAMDAICRMKAEYSEEVTQGRDLQLEVMSLHLGSLKSVVTFAEEYKNKDYPLHVLICNAGIAYAPQGVTVDGYERQFQINYLAHFLLILLLLPILRQTGDDCRIINVSSVEHRVGVFDLENIQAQKSYDRRSFYGNSKLFQVMMTYALERRLPDSSIRVFSLHPGAVSTEIDRNFKDSPLHSKGFQVLRTIGYLKDRQHGAATSVRLAVDPAVTQNPAMYYSECNVAETSPGARVEADQEALWKYSLELLKDYLTPDVLQS